MLSRLNPFNPRLNNKYNSKKAVLFNVFIQRHMEMKPGKQLGGFEYKEEIEPFKSKWRTPMDDRPGFWKSKLDLFRNRRFQGNLFKYHPSNFKFFSLRSWLKGHKKEHLIYDQRFIPERQLSLGHELAAAHFVVFRGGAVKFNHSDTWIKDDQNKKDYDDDLPNIYDPNFIIEAIDLSGTKIIYEGLQNIENLTALKWLSFANCPYFDNWCLDKISGEYGNTLEYLDISNTNVSYHGFKALYRFKNLKILAVSDFYDDPKFYLTCLELKKFLPDIRLDGVSAEIMQLADEYEEKQEISVSTLTK